ncbi:MAG: type II toxin-antitoxin system RelE/ParE family toxin [Acidimicrobiia bacterium]|nr:type II toxin-antitoxin system RelE/ParE family toxin [Acidimicrobiia bacterium]
MNRIPVRWSRAALRDLHEILDYIERDRPGAARRMGARIMTAAGSLRCAPKSGKVVPELAEHGITDYRQRLVGPYRLVYRAHNDRADVLAVVDSRRDLEAVLFRRLVGV